MGVSKARSAPVEGWEPVACTAAQEALSSGAEVPRGRGKLKSLNAWLKVSAYLHAHNVLPDAELLRPHMEHVRAGYRALLVATGANAALLSDMLDKAVPNPPPAFAG